MWAPTRTEATETEYRRRAADLRRQAAEDLGYESPESAPAKVVADWLIGRQPTLSRSTWRQYRAALLFTWAELQDGAPDLMSAQQLTAGIDALKAVTQTGARRQGQSTSALKAKKVAESDLAALLAILDTPPRTWQRTWARPTAVWVRASALTGLRPNEWFMAGLDSPSDGGPQTLVVYNGKFGNLRANGKTRRLILDPAVLDPEAIAVILEQLQFIDGVRAEHANATVQRMVAKTLRDANRLCFGARYDKRPHITLYSFRHQFTADAKASGFSRKEVAALLGHGSDETAGFHYAKRRQGTRRIGVRPDPYEVTTVRERASQFWHPTADPAQDVPPEFDDADDQG